MLLGKCFRRARLARSVGDRSIKAGDVQYTDDYCFIHLGVWECTGPGLASRLGSARLGSIWPGSTRLGPPLGMTRLAARLDLAQHLA